MTLQQLLENDYDVFGYQAEGRMLGDLCVAIEVEEPCQESLSIGSACARHELKNPRVKQVSGGTLVHVLYFPDHGFEEAE